MQLNEVNSYDMNSILPIKWQNYLDNIAKYSEYRTPDSYFYKPIDYSEYLSKQIDYENIISEMKKAKILNEAICNEIIIKQNEFEGISKIKDKNR